MATAKRTQAPKESSWARLVREAKKDYKPTPPYVFDGCTPAIEIAAPDGLERQLALARLVDTSADELVPNLVPMLEALTGPDAFPFIWKAIRDEPIEVTMALIDSLNEHFNGIDDSTADAGAEDFPGGDVAS